MKDVLTRLQTAILGLAILITAREAIQSSRCVMVTQIPSGVRIVISYDQDLVQMMALLR